MLPGEKAMKRGEGNYNRGETCSMLAVGAESESRPDGTWGRQAVVSDRHAQTVAHRNKALLWLLVSLTQVECIPTSVIFNLKPGFAS